MAMQLFPAEIIDNTVEAYMPTVTVKSQLIFITVILAIILSLAALPFVKVNVSVNSPGMVRTVSEKSELTSSVPGRVATWLVSENQSVTAGQNLVVLGTEMQDNKLSLLRFQMREKQQYIRDLTQLVRLDNEHLTEIKGLQSSLYAQQYNQLQFQLQDNQYQQRKLQGELQTDRQLQKEQLISARELSEKEYNYKRLTAEYKSAIERQIGLWQADLTTHQIALTELQSQEVQLLKEKELFIIKAPVSGTVQQVAGKYSGSAIQAGESLGIISPDSSLLVECYVSPKDIGLVEQGMDIVYQVDAFNYNDWGFAKGKVLEISQDFQVINEQPVFRVKCILQTKSLQLKNGYKADLKKGMTLRARFVVAERSLWQLLYDKMDDWLNPNIKTT